MLESFLRSLLQRRLGAVLFAVGALVVALVFVPRISVNDSPERWLPASISKAWDRFGEHFEHGDTIAIGLHFREGARDEDLQYLKQLRNEVERVPGVLKVIDVSLLAEEVERVRLTEMLAPPEDEAADPFALYRGVLFDDPRVWNSDGHAKEPGNTLLTVIDLDANVDAGIEGDKKQEVLDERRRTAVSKLYEILERNRRPDVTVHMIGGVVIQYELEAIARRMVAAFVPLSGILTLVALGVGFRSLAAVAIALLAGAWSMTLLVGGIALAGWTLDVVTVSCPPLMAVIVIATTVHFAHHYSVRPAEAASGEGPRSVSRSSEESRHFIRWVAVPCFGASLAAGVGFLMLAFNELGPAREMGVELFVGALLAFSGAFLAWLVLHPFRAAPGRMLSGENLRTLHRVVVAYPRSTVAGTLVVTGALIATSLGVRLDADPFSFFQPESSFAKALRHLSERQFGHYVLDVVLVPKSRGGDAVATAEEREADLVVAREFQSRVKARPEVRNVVSALEIQARMQSLQMLVADFRRAMVFKDMFRNWTVDRKGEGAIRITFTVTDSGMGFGAFMRTVEETLPHQRFDVILTGTVASVVALTDGLVGGIARGLAVALFVMALLCYLLFRSMRLTAIAFLPNAFPILFIFGLMGVLDIPLNSGSAMVATIALGMGLNDTVHFVMHYRRRRLDGESADDAVAGTFAEIGRPLIMTSTVNCIGFAIFLVSDFRPLCHFGLLSSVAMIAALVGDMVLLPNLLKLFDRDAPQRFSTQE